ncbi:MAG: hypothetical protein IJR93_07770 [Treponema sp.]|nr:hypothetical protein [Treponema sp.]
MLIFPLKKEWYEKIRSGAKRIEYREVKPYWTDRIAKEYKNELLEDGISERISSFYIFRGENHFCKLRLGYANKYMTAKIVKIMVVDGEDTDLHIDRPVFAIHLADVKEEKNDQERID